MEKATPFFSIVIPTYNRSRYLKEAINSIIQQSFTDWELIVVDDASTDDTQSVVKAFNRPNIIYRKNEKNKERGYSRNKGIAAASGKYICFLDSDDTFFENHLQTFFDWLKERPGFSGMVFANIKLINQDTGQVDNREVPYYDEAPDKFAYLLHYTPNPARVCVSADVLKVFLFDESIPGLEDLDLWLHIATRFPIHHIQLYTSLYRVHAESYTSGDTKRYQKELKNFRKIFSKPELKSKLPKKSTNRLISMCYYHLSAIYESRHETAEMYKAVVKSFILCPEGYNLRTNKVLLVRFLYHLPVLGRLAESITKLRKKNAA